MLEKIISHLKRLAYAVAVPFYLWGVRFLLADNNRLKIAVCNKFIYNKKWLTVLPKVRLSELANLAAKIKIREPIKDKGNISLFEIAVINWLIKSYHPVNLFEIGTFDGRTALNMAINCPAASKVYTLDLSREQMQFTRLPLAGGDLEFINKDISGVKYLKTKYKDKITQLYGDSAELNFFPYQDKMDFVFVDGSHSYEYVLHDSETALKLLRHGKGIVLWHDYGKWQDVTRALEELSRNGPKFASLKHIDGTSLVCLVNR